MEQGGYRGRVVNRAQIETLPYIKPRLLPRFNLTAWIIAGTGPSSSIAAAGAYAGGRGQKADKGRRSCLEDRASIKSKDLTSGVCRILSPARQELAQNQAAPLSAGLLPLPMGSGCNFPSSTKPMAWL